MLCRPCDAHHLPLWLGRASSTIDLSSGSNYGTFVVEWWTPMCSKKELGSARLGDGHPRLLIHRESMSPPYYILTECRYTRTKGPQRCI